MKFWILQLVMFVAYSMLLHILSKERMVWWVSLVHFMSLAMLRADSVGTDTRAYSVFYLQSRIPQDIRELFSSQMMGFNLFKLPFLMLFPYGYMWMVLSGVIPTILVWVFIRRNSSNISLSIFLYLVLYFYFQNMNAGRQAIAMGFALMSIDCIYRKRYIISIPFSIIAFIIHPAGTVLLLVVYVLSFIRWSFRKYLVALLFSLATGVVFATAMVLFVQTRFVLLFKYYSGYSFDAWQSGGRMGYFYFFVLLYVIYGTIKKGVGISLRGKRVSIAMKRDIVDGEPVDKGFDENQAMLLSVTLISIQLIFCIVLREYVFVSRATNLIFQLSIIILPWIMKDKSRYSFWINRLFILGVIGYFALRLIGNYGNVWPYETFIVL